MKARLLVATTVALALLGARLLLVDRRNHWMDADTDGDGLPLRADADPDGDALPDDPDADDDGVPNAADAVAGARTMLGAPSDPLMGRYGDPLGRLGFRVCVDVVVEAWMAAGVSLPERLLRTALTTPGRFAITPDNAPGDPYFVRRVRNYRALFAEELRGAPMDGDLAFFGDHHVAIDVATTGGIQVIEAFDPLIRVRRVAEVEARTGTKAAYASP